MNLKSVRFENFQGVLDPVEIEIRNLTVLVGRNDVGKSTALKAIDLFLNSNAPNEDTRNAFSTSHIVAVELAFELSESKILIDESIETTLAAECLFDEKLQLRVRREWDVSAARPSSKTFIRRQSFGSDDFLLATETELLRRCAALGLDTKKANGEDYNNVEKRQKLRDALLEQGVAVTFEWLLLPAAGTSRAKRILDAVRGLLPQFQYFRADSSLNESDAAIQKYFRGTTSAALAGVGMAEVEGAVRNALQGVLSAISNKINQVLTEREQIAPHVEFDWARAVTTSFRTTANQAPVPMTQRGDGFRRIAMMAYFEHLAEQQANGAQQTIFGFEEPETFLHPTAQEQLFEKLEGLCEAGHQVLITSHSPIIVARAKTASLVHAVKTANGTAYINTVHDLRSIADDIGIKVDNQFWALFDRAKFLLLVEGIDDAMALQHVSEEYKGAGHIARTLAELEVAVLPIGGCGSIQHWVQLDLLRKLTKPYFIFLDSDKESATADSPNEAALVALGFTPGVDCAVSRRRALENYIPPAALNRFVPGANINYGDFDHVKNICKAHVLAGRLGGGKVAERYFSRLSYQDLKSEFCPDGVNDEFLALYGSIVGRL